MSIENDGGPAFPTDPTVQFAGMSLRDYFAAAALTGICASSLFINSPNGAIAKEAYSLADKMIKARSIT